VYLPERLTGRHDLAAFDCGVPSLSEWLRRTALTAQAKGVTVTDVWADAARVVAYYSVSPTAVVSDGLPRGATTGLDVIPGYLLGRLALNRSLHGQGLGERLLVHALERILRAADEGGGRLVMVDAIDDAAAEFYAYFGFRSIPGTMRLFMKVATIRDARLQIQRSLDARGLPVGRHLPSSPHAT
jgi:GNAT superfamily N-acetyltransferase